MAEYKNASVHLGSYESPLVRTLSLLVTTVFRGSSESEIFRMLLEDFAVKQGIIVEGKFDETQAKRIRDKYINSPVLNLPERLVPMENLKDLVQNVRKLDNIEATETKAEVVTGDTVNSGNVSDIQPSCDN